ncbi:MAG: efflux RND transporter periplasmic adaptor subunit, partial [Muribaculaceae bacterium]|nr:efflux RND transporter periplasmic adaptor subunit [Muribaculaceae bacterium]
GSFVGSAGNTLLATIVNSDTVQIEFSMTSLDYLNSKARNVNFGQRDEKRNWDPSVTITLADGSIYPLRGLVDFADPRVDPKTGTFSVRAEMPNPDHTLLPGEFTKVKLLMDVREAAIAVPAKALEIEKGGAYIYVVKPDSIVERRFVEIGPDVANSTIIERGLAKGETIIVDGYQKVKHGQKVDPIPEDNELEDED